MTQVHKIYQYEDKTKQSADQNQFEAVEKIVDDIVQKGIPKNLSFSEFVVYVSNNYNINIKEAKTCIRLAMNELDDSSSLAEESKDELYAESGYYYPKGYNTSNTPNAKQDGMDSLSCLGSYNKLMFLK